MAKPEPLADALVRFRRTGESLQRVAAQLEPFPGLAEAERLGLRVLVELVGEALEHLRHPVEMGKSKTMLLREAGDGMCWAADRLPANPTEEQVAEWLPPMESAVRALLAVVGTQIAAETPVLSAKTPR